MGYRSEAITCSATSIAASMLTTQAHLIARIRVWPASSWSSSCAASYAGTSTR